MLRRLFPVVLLLLSAAQAQTAKRAISVTPTSIDFGSVAVGSSVNQSVQVTNTGRFSVKISGITSSSSSFVVQAPVMPVYLSAGTAMNLSVSFVPVTGGSVSGSVTISSNAQNSPTSIAVQGTGTVPVTSTTTSTVAYGNTGDPYEGGSPGTAVMLAACQILQPNTSYRLSGNVSALTATDVCFQWSGANTTLDLNGYKVTGRIVGSAVNISGANLFNGTVECARDASLGGNVGCIWLYGDYFQPSAQVRVHHLNVFNSAACGRTVQLNWDTTVAWTGGQYLVRLYNITSAAASGPTCTRAYNFGITASDVITAEVNNNDLTCPADTAACQGVMFYGNDKGRIHHNRITMMQNLTTETGRATLCDGHADSCEVDNNLIIANNNRAFRVRDSMHARIHDNTVQRVTCCNATAVHLGDPDTGSNDLDVILENNSFEVVDGTVLMIRAGYNAWFRNNTLTCAGCSGTSNLATVRNMGTTNIVFENNPTAMALGTPQIYVETSASASVCNSGSATGPGTITYPTCN